MARARPWSRWSGSAGTDRAQRPSMAASMLCRCINAEAGSGGKCFASSAKSSLVAAGDDAAGHGLHAPDGPDAPAWGIMRVWASRARLHGPMPLVERGALDVGEGEAAHARYAAEALQHRARRGWRTCGCRCTGTPGLRSDLDRKADGGLHAHLDDRHRLRSSARRARTMPPTLRRRWTGRSRSPVRTGTALAALAPGRDAAPMTWTF